MFTGIVEEVGIIQAISSGEKSSKLLIKANTVLEDTKLGDSICTNGVCLTVVDINRDTFKADVMAETLRRSNLGKLQVGTEVNLERALKLESRLGGHLVSGHIDGIGEIVSFIKEDNAIWLTIKATANILRYIVEKGSITIDGISLTVAYVDSEIFKVSLIPHTWKETALSYKKTGDIVNLECDMIAKYVEKLLGLNTTKDESSKSSIDEKFLRENGFM